MRKVYCKFIAVNYYFEYTLFWSQSHESIGHMKFVKRNYDHRIVFDMV